MDHRINRSKGKNMIAGILIVLRLLGII